MEPIYLAYCTVALICVVAMLRFHSVYRQYAPDTTANRFFRIAILGSVMCALMEFCFVFHECGYITNLWYCYATEICYSLSSLVSGYFWFLSSETEQNARTVSSKRNLILISIPFVLMVSLILTTPFHQLVFYFTDDGHYVRGLFNNVFVVITALFIAKSGFAALLKAFRHEHYLRRGLYLTFFYYALSIVIAQVFQILLGSVLPFRVIGAAILFYVVQERTLKENVYIDITTDANNRTAMERYLKNHFDTADESFVYVMIDLDDFKDINDHYGHTMGDQALHLVSAAFKSALTANFFFARYGGDEFVLIGKTETEGEVESLLQTVRDNISRLVKEAGVPFCPAFSYGVCRMSADIHSVPDLINRADSNMYENKKANKAKRK